MVDTQFTLRNNAQRAAYTQNKNTKINIKFTKASRDIRSLSVKLSNDADEEKFKTFAPQDELKKSDTALTNSGEWYNKVENRSWLFV